MDIFNNNDANQLDIKITINSPDNNSNDGQDVFASAASNKENIGDSIPLNWDNNKELSISKLQIKECGENSIEINLASASAHKENIGDPLALLWDNTADRDNIPDDKKPDFATAAANREYIKSEPEPLIWNNILSTQSAVENSKDVDPQPNYNEQENLLWEYVDEQTEVKVDVKPQLKLNWSEWKGDPINEEASAVAPPRVYKYMEVYQAKKKNALRQREEEERKAREFHSQPMPNFRALHKRLANVQVVHRITVPITPETVKHSIADRERRKRKEQQETQSGQTQTQTDDAKLARKLKLETKPFYLRADQRVNDRREYDAAVQQNMAEKVKKIDEHRKQQELEQQRELRKMTEFKARPNPFK